MELHEAPEIYEKIIYQDDVKENQIRLVVSTFRGVEYLHLRKYYMEYEGDWCPSNQGVAMLMDIETTKELFIGLAEIISLAESRETIEKYFGDMIRDVYSD
ncbi:hypothetical protein DRN75_03090 [Nanoarchaeota archaeon]|nr:MAG: hypothetical protein DRN75_03090 [Nanoarchaeota archaeon]